LLCFTLLVGLDFAPGFVVRGLVVPGFKLGVRAAPVEPGAAGLAARTGGFLAAGSGAKLSASSGSIDTRSAISRRKLVGIGWSIIRSKGQSRR
jgi:hypothetical protein